MAAVDELFQNPDEVTNAYEDVRNDDTPTNWLLLEYDDKTIQLSVTGEDYDELLSKFDETNRAYAYVRVMTGDEMSKRAKFVFIAWVGNTVSPIKKAKTSTDKNVVKQIIQNFGAEVHADEREQVSYDRIKEKLVKAGGANYGTGAH